jgi:hypothetical protein
MKPLSFFVFVLLITGAVGSADILSPISAASGLGV